MEKYIPFFLKLQAQTQMWHWQTSTYASHVALGGYYEAIQELTDKFVEATKGKNPHGATPELQNATIEIKGIVNVDLVEHYAGCATYLCDLSKDEYISSNIEIQDIIVDMMNETHKLVYLLRLK
jgi:hypothetical protein